MFEQITNTIKRGLAKLGIIKDLKDLSEHKKISENARMFNYIDVWQSLYFGKHEGIHEVEHHTIKEHTTRLLKSLGMPKVATSEMASLIFNEKCEINIDKENVNELFQDVMKKNKFNKNFQDYLEYALALGGMVIKPYYDEGSIKLSFVDATAFVPISWSNGNIYEAVFPFKFVEKKKHYTHLEWHVFEDGVYTIKNELYESSSETVTGQKVPLTTSEKTRELESIVPIEHVTHPFFVYIRPNTANNIDLGSPLGISIYANAIDTIEAIDTAFDSFHREFRLGKKRILVPSKFIRTIVDPHNGRATRLFDTSDETYEQYASELSDDNNDIKDISVELRIDEHVAGINALLNIFAMQTGFSTGTFTFDGQSMKTATEVISENSKTFKTKKSHEMIIEGALTELVNIVVNIAELYDVREFGSLESEYDVQVAFDDSVAEDRTADINRQILLVNSGLQSKVEAMMKIYKISEDKALELNNRINSEIGLNAQSERVQESILFGNRE